MRLIRLELAVVLNGDLSLPPARGLVIFAQAGAAADTARGTAWARKWFSRHTRFCSAFSPATKNLLSGDEEPRGAEAGEFPLQSCLMSLPV